MPQFPVRYSEAAPSGQSQSVRASLDTNAGEEIMWGAVARSGERLADVGLDIFGKIKAAEDHIKSSEEQRDIDGIGDAFATKASMLPDPAERAKELAAAEQAMAKKATMPQTQAYVNQAVSRLREHNMRLDVGFKVKDLSDRFDAQAQRLILSGDRASFDSLVDGAASNALITPAKGESLKASFDTNARLAKATELSNVDPDAAKLIVSGIKPTTPEENSQKVEYERRLDAAIKQKQYELFQGIVEQVVAAGELPMNDALKMLDEADKAMQAAMKSKKESSSITGTQAHRIQMGINGTKNRVMGGTGKVDYRLVVKFADRINNIDQDTNPSVVNELKLDMMENSAQLGSELATLNDRLNARYAKKGTDEAERDKKNYAIISNVVYEKVKQYGLSQRQQTLLGNFAENLYKSDTTIKTADLLHRIAEEAVLVQSVGAEDDGSLDAEIAFLENRIAENDKLWNWARNEGGLRTDEKISEPVTVQEFKDGVPGMPSYKEMTLGELEYYNSILAMRKNRLLDKKKKRAMPAMPTSQPASAPSQDDLTKLSNDELYARYRASKSPTEQQSIKDEAKRRKAAAK